MSNLSDQFDCLLFDMINILYLLSIITERMGESKINSRSETIIQCNLFDWKVNCLQSQRYSGKSITFKSLDNNK